MRNVLALSSIVAVLGCASGGDRTVEIVQTLTLADRGLIAARPALVQEKYEKMGEHAYNFARGSLPLFRHDAAGRPDLLERFGDERVRTNGDPHPENLGTFGDASGVLVDWNDYDAAGISPATLDVIRLGYTTAIFIGETTLEDGDAWVDEFLDGYESAIPHDGGLVIAALTERALEKGEERDELDDVTMGVSGPVFERDGEDVVDAEPELVSEMFQALPAYAPTRVAGAPPLGQMRDVVKIVGKGVTSLPLDRYLVLIAGPQADGSEDRVLAVKEAWDGGLDEDGRVIGSKGFVAERIVETARAVGAGPAMDLDLGVLHASGKAYVVRGASGYAQDLDFDRMQEKWGEGDFATEDLGPLARFIGGTLALAHYRGGISSTDLDERANLERAILDFAAQTRNDHALFAKRLEDGPIVGE